MDKFSSDGRKMAKSIYKGDRRRNLSLLQPIIAIRSI